eukprot:COSAG01_NODE_15124_length_1372_cov_1.446976_2_plen_74_part_01
MKMTNQYLAIRSLQHKLGHMLFHSTLNNISISTQAPNSSVVRVWTVQAEKFRVRLLPRSNSAIPGHEMTTGDSD